METAEVTKLPGSKEELDLMMAEVRDEARKEAEDLLAVWKTKELAQLAEEQQKTIQEEVKKLFKTWQEEQKPPSKEEIQKLVDQEYAEIPIELFVKMANSDTAQKREFVLRELPQSVERRFYHQLSKRLKDKLPQMAAFTQKNMDQPFEKIVSDFMDTFDGAFDVMADAVAIILNPFDDDKEITAEWVSKNISSNRQYSIITAQMEVNKMRDFFSRLFRSGQKASTILTPLNIRQLQELARS